MPGPLTQPDPTVVAGDEPASPLTAATQDPGDLFGEGSMLLFDDEVGTIVNRATRGQWPADQVRQALEQTNAFQEVTARRQALADPTTGQAARQDLAVRVAGMLGRTPTDPLTTEMVGRLEAGGATFASLQSLFAPMQLQGTPVERVMELAATHGIPMRPETAAEYAQMQEGDVDQELAFTADQLYPYKPPGMPWRRFAGVFADLQSSELGQDVTVDDPLLKAKIAEAQGQPGIFQQLIRQTPAWEDSDTAQQLFQERADQVLHDLQYGQAAGETMQTNAGQYQLQEAVGGQAAQPTAGGGGGGGGGSYGGGEGVTSMAGFSSDEAWIIQRESGGRTSADNPTSTAFGLGQLLYANRVRYAAMVGASGPDTTDFEEQKAMFRAYVKERYGTAARAKAFWQANGWY